MRNAIVVFASVLLTGTLAYADSTKLGAPTNLQPNFVGVTMPSPQTTNNYWPFGGVVFCPWDPSHVGRAQLLYNSYGNNPANACPDPATGRYNAYGSKTAAQVQSDSIYYELCPDQCITQRTLIDNSVPPRKAVTTSTASGIYEPTCLNNYAQLTLTSYTLIVAPNQYVGRNTDITPETPTEVQFYLNNINNNWDCSPGLSYLATITPGCQNFRSPEPYPVNVPYYNPAISTSYVVRLNNISANTCYADINCWSGGGTATCGTSNSHPYIYRRYAVSAYGYCRCTGNFCVTAKHVPDLVVCGHIKQGWKKTAP